MPGCGGTEAGWGEDGRGSASFTCGHDHAAHERYRPGSECAGYGYSGWRPNRDRTMESPCCTAGHAGYDRAWTAWVNRPGAVALGRRRFRSVATRLPRSPDGLSRSSTGPANMSVLSPNSGSDRLCRCGHAYVAHEHYRSGSECSLCSECPRFRPAHGLVARIMHAGRSSRCPLRAFSRGSC